MKKEQPKKMKRKERDWYVKIRVDAFSDDELELMDDLCSIEFDKNDLKMYEYPDGLNEYRINKRLWRKLDKCNLSRDN